MKAPNHSIVYTGGGGRLGNQFIRFAHWLAWARAQEGRVEVVDLAFWPFAQYFAIWDANPACIFPLRRSATANLAARLSARLPGWLRMRTEWRWQSLVQKTGKWLPTWQSIALRDDVGEAIDLDSPLFTERITSTRVTTCRGWKIAGWQLFSEHQAELRKLFLPSAPFSQRAQEFIVPLRKQHEVLAGLLIRRSDYRYWSNGRFFFSADRYTAWIRELLVLYKNQRLAVIIASDEWLDPSIFAGLPCHFATGSINAGGHWFESFAELSLCDFILSPPSTFSAAAAFVGNVPLWPLVEGTQVLSADQLMMDSIVDAARHPLFSAAVK